MQACCRGGPAATRKTPGGDSGEMRPPRPLSGTGLTPLVVTPRHFCLLQMKKGRGHLALVL